MGHFIFLPANFMIINDKSKNKVEIAKLKERKKYIWFIKISILAFCLSLMLALFSELVLNRAHVIIAVILLIIFMLLNVFSDMLGLAITSCQIEELKKQVKDEGQLKFCLKLIKSSDKVSSILCDVVGDICGILCGVSGTMISYVIVRCVPVSSFNIFIGAFISALIAGLTVLLKAISKNYAVNHSTKIVKKIVNFMSSLKFFKKRRNDETCLKSED